MRNTLLRMLVALMCALTVCADITPAADFDLQKVRDGLDSADIPQTNIAGYSCSNCGCVTRLLHEVLRV